MVLTEDGLTHRPIRPDCREQNGLIERANRTIREGVEEADPSNYLELQRVLEKLTKRYNHERRHRAFGYLPVPSVFPFCLNGGRVSLPRQQNHRTR